MPEIRLAALARRWFALAGALALLLCGGRGVLAAPPSAGPAALGAWAGARPPVVTALAAIRLLTLGAGGYLLVVVSVAILGQASGHRPTLVLAARLTPAGLRPLLALAATTATIAAGLTLVAGGADGAARVTPPPILRWVAPSRAAPTPPNRGAPTSPNRGAPTPTNRGAPAAPSRPTAAGAHPGRAVRTTTPTTTARGTSPAPRAPRRASATGPTHYVIRHGDSFWSIATARLETSTGDVPPDQEQIAHYWQALVQANLTMLPVPGHPDLLFPGDRIRLPPLLRGPEER